MTTLRRALKSLTDTKSIKISDREALFQLRFAATAGNMSTSIYLVPAGLLA